MKREAAQLSLFYAEVKSELNYAFHSHMLHGAHWIIYLDFSVV